MEPYNVGSLCGKKQKRLLESASDIIWRKIYIVKFWLIGIENDKTANKPLARLNDKLV